MDFSTINLTRSIVLFLGLVLTTIGAAGFISWINPRETIRIVRQAKELQKLDKQLAYNLKHSGILTKFIFRMFAKGSERYFS